MSESSLSQVCTSTVPRIWDAASMCVSGAQPGNDGGFRSAHQGGRGGSYPIGVWECQLGRCVWGVGGGSVSCVGRCKSVSWVGGLCRIVWRLGGCRSVWRLCVKECQEARWVWGMQAIQSTYYVYIGCFASTPIPAVRCSWQGGTLLLAYSTGYVSPLLLAASATGALKQLLSIRAYSAWVTPASGR